MSPASFSILQMPRDCRLSERELIDDVVEYAGCAIKYAGCAINDKSATALRTRSRAADSAQQERPRWGGSAWHNSISTTTTPVAGEWIPGDAEALPDLIEAPSLNTGAPCGLQFTRSRIGAAPAAGSSRPRSGSRLTANFRSATRGFRATCAVRWPSRWTRALAHGKQRAEYTNVARSPRTTD